MGHRVIKKTVVRQQFSFPHPDWPEVRKPRRPDSIGAGKQHTRKKLAMNGDPR